MKVAVLADGGVSLPAGGDLPGVAVVGMHLDGELAAGNGTAAPSPGAFLAAMERAGRGVGVLVVTVASQLSASHAAARLASAEVAAGRPVAVIDSGSASAGEGLVVLAAARAASRGEPLADVAAAARAARERVRLVAQIADLDRLARGGRVPAVAAAGARLVGMRPVFELTRGDVRPLRPAFSPPAAEQRILGALAQDHPGDGARLHVAGLHAGDEASALRLLEGASRLAEPAEQFLSELSPVMIAHTGEGVSGLAWWWEG